MVSVSTRRSSPLKVRSGIIERCACAWAPIRRSCAEVSSLPMITMPSDRPAPVPSSAGPAATIMMPRLVRIRPRAGVPAARLRRQGKLSGNALSAAKFRFKGALESRSQEPATTKFPFRSTIITMLICSCFSSSALMYLSTNSAVGVCKNWYRSAQFPQSAALNPRRPNAVLSAVVDALHRCPCLITLELRETWHQHPLLNGDFKNDH